MSDACRHGKHHFHHHHHHVGLAEGITPVYVKKLQIAVGLAVLYFGIQAVGSFFSGSLALLADAGHKLADIGSISLALFASWFSHLSVSPRKTFGYYRLEILAALINGLGLMFVAAFILWEAMSRVIHHSEVHIEGGLMLGVSICGLLINIISARVLFPAKELNLNVKGALFHIMADIVNSLGESLTAVAILLFHATWLDTLVSVLIASLVFLNALHVFKEALNILMESAPSHLDLEAIRSFVMDKPGVTDVHDLHVWTITTGKDALLAHVRVDDEYFGYQTAQSIEKSLREAFDLCHITVQLEPPLFEEETPPF
jgi:cobalt-zinc-cadmium efflux system protein